MSGSDTDTEAPPRELLVDAKPAPGDASDGAGTAMLPFLAPAVVAGALAKYVSPAMGLAGLGVGVLVLLVLRKPDDGRFLLRVDGAERDGRAELVVVREKRKDAPVARFALVDLADVTLDRETSAGGRPGTAKERVRLAFERHAPADPVFVPDERITALEGQEWLAKVRLFLRKHGWVPESEREEAPPSA